MKFLFFSFSESETEKMQTSYRPENGESGLSHEGADGTIPQNFWARTAPGCVLSIPSASSAEDHGQELYPFELAKVAYCYSVNPKIDNTLSLSVS